MAVYTAATFSIRIVRGLIIPTFLAPALYGLWLSLTVILGYTKYADLGVQQQLAKRLPYELGSRGNDGYWELAGKGAAWVASSSLVMATILVIASFLYHGEHVEFYSSALRVLAFIIIAQNARSLLRSYLVSREDFRIVALNGMLADSLSLVGAVIGVVTIGVMGLLWAFLIAEVVGTIHCVQHLWSLGIRTMRWRLTGVRAMIAEGLLMLGIVLMQQLGMTVDQLFVLKFFTKAEYGLYGFGLFLATAMIAISGIFATAQPRILELVGGGDGEKSSNLVEASLALYVLIAGLSIIAFLPLTDIVVHFYLKQYRAGLVLYSLMPAIALGRGLLVTLRPHFLAADRERHLIGYQVLGVLVTVVLDACAIWRGWGMGAILSASAIGAFVTGVVMLREFEGTRRKVGKAKYIVLAAAVAGTIGIYVAYAQLAANQSSVHYLLSILAITLGYTALIGLAVYVTWHEWALLLGAYLEGSSRPFLRGIRARLMPAESVAP